MELKSLLFGNGTDYWGEKVLSSSFFSNFVCVDPYIFWNITSQYCHLVIKCHLGNRY